MWLICIMTWIQMADPRGRGHSSAGGGVLHLASGVRVPERALPHYQPQWLPGANPPRGPQTSTWGWGRGKREERCTPGKLCTLGEENVDGSYVHFNAWLWIQINCKTKRIKKNSLGLQGEEWLGCWVLPQPLPSCFLPPCCWRGRGDDEEGIWAWQGYAYASSSSLSSSWIILVPVTQTASP